MTTEPAKDGTPAENPAPKRMGIMIATRLKHFRDQPRPGESPAQFAKAQADDLQRQVPQIAKALRELKEREAEHEYVFEFAAACGGLCSASNRLLHDFLHKSTGQIVVFWDADLHDQAGKDADAILRQLALMRENGAHVLGRMYCKREKRPRWVGNWITGAKIQAGGVLQMAELGLGAKAYSRKALEELRRIYVEVPLTDLAGGAQPMHYRDRETGEMVTAFFQIRLVEGDLLSEDYFLDWLCRCAKLPIWADTVARCRQLDGKQFYPAVGQPWPPIPAQESQ